MKIIVDAFGGDKAPEEIIRGCVAAIASQKVEIILVGDSEKIDKVLDDENLDDEGIEIAHAPEMVTMEDDPTDAVRNKKNSSMMFGLKLLKEGYGDAYVSGGNTGALMMGATLIVKRMKGVKRAALATILPSKTGPVILLDCGANVECTPEQLVEFGVMGTYYMRGMYSLDEPEVGLVNIGTESHKGTAMHQKAYQLLESKEDINFIGNVEPRTLMEGGLQIAVCDGFTGNIVLKSIEGMSQFFIGELRDIFSAGTSARMAFAAVRNGVVNMKKKLDYKEIGGAPLMGISKPVIKAHGSSNARAIESAIRQAVKIVNAGLYPELEGMFASQAKGDAEEENN